MLCVYYICTRRIDVHKWRNSYDPIPLLWRDLEEQYLQLSQNIRTRKVHCKKLMLFSDTCLSRGPQFVVSNSLTPYTTYHIIRVTYIIKL